jgi:hypothetical protein
MRAREDQPPVDFWENTIELPATRLLQEANSPEFINDWVQRRKPRQVAMLRHLLGLPDAPLRERKARLKDHWDELVRFVPAAAFAARKSMHATLDVAAGCLEEATVALAREGDGGYDTTALIFAILDQSWPDLEKVFHLDKLHKVGFARMRLPQFLDHQGEGHDASGPYRLWRQGPGDRARLLRGGARGRSARQRPRPACARNIIPTTMAPSCSIRTATISRRSARTRVS